MFALKQKSHSNKERAMKLTVLHLADGVNESARPSLKLILLLCMTEVFVTVMVIIPEFLLLLFFWYILSFLFLFPLKNKLTYNAFFYLFYFILFWLKISLIFFAYLFLKVDYFRFLICYCKYKANSFSKVDHKQLITASTPAWRSFLNNFL